MCCNTLQHTATHRNTAQHTAIHPVSRCNCCNTLENTATPCDALQHTATAATHWKTLQHPTTHRYTSCFALLGKDVTDCNTLQCAATHCNTRQRAATHCNSLQHTATHYNNSNTSIVSSGRAVDGYEFFFVKNNPILHQTHTHANIKCI